MKFGDGGQLDRARSLVIGISQEGRRTLLSGGAEAEPVYPITSSAWANAASIAAHSGFSGNGKDAKALPPSRGMAFSGLGL